MADINFSEVKKLTRNSNNSQTLQEFRYPYKDNYKLLNELIIESAKSGKNYISFDFINSDNDVKENGYRIYAQNKEWTYAEYDVYDYPNYLIAKGFNVEVRKNEKNHGYKTLSYYISW